MITPQDIQTKEFAKSMRGYKAEEVDLFLDLITLDLEKLIKENARLKEELEQVKSQRGLHGGSKDEISSVMEQARDLLDDISKSADKRAGAIVQSAEMDADLIIRQAKENAGKILREQKNLRTRYELFRDNYKRMLEDELKRFDTLEDELFPEFNDHKLEDLLGDTESESQEAGDEGMKQQTMVMKTGDEDSQNRKTMVMEADNTDQIKDGGGE